MSEGVEKSIEAILDDPKLARELRNSIRVLEIIRDLTSKSPDITPSTVTEVYYKDKTDNIPTAEKKMKFLKTKKSRISRMISSLAKMKLIEVTDPPGKLDKRNRLYRLTGKGLALLMDEDIRIKLEKKVKGQQGLSKTTPDEYLEQYKRKYHSDNVRNLLIRIRTELGQAFIKEVFSDDLSFTFILYRLERFPFENDILYEDLENHLSTFISYSRFKELLDRFKDTGKEYITLESTLETMVRLELDHGLGIPLYLNDKTMNGYSTDLVLWLIKGLNLLYQQKNEPFNRYYKEFRYDVVTEYIGEHRLKQVRINGVNVMVLLKTEDHGKYIKRLRNLIEHLADTPVAKEFSKYRSLEEEVQMIRADMIMDLNKEIEVPIYPGKCRYLSTG